MMPVHFPEDGVVLDLRIPEKQKISSGEYTSIYPSPNASPEYRSSQEKDQKSFIVCTEPDRNPHITAIQNNSPPIKSPMNVSVGCESPSSTVSSSDSLQSSDMSSRTSSKRNRPFKTLTKDPFLGIKTAVNLLHEDVDYPTFREKMLAQSRLDYNSTNMNMKRKTVTNENNSDPVYWEKRKKNNEAAKKSRDARKAREDEIAIRCAFLEQENLKLKLKIAAVQSDTERMQNLIYRL